MGKLKKFFCHEKFLDVESSLEKKIRFLKFPRIISLVVVITFLILTRKCVIVYHSKRANRKPDTRLALDFIEGGYGRAVLCFTDGSRKYEYVTGVVTTQVKGHLQYSEDKTWDVADIVIPPRGPDEFFIMTNVYPTLAQTQTTCDEDPEVEDVTCQTDIYCSGLKVLGMFKESQGPFTGKCVKSTHPSYNGSVCEIHGWCPVRNVVKNEDAKLLMDTLNFTVLIKNDIAFPAFDVDWYNSKSLNESEFRDGKIVPCLYNASDAIGRFCPIFKLITIVEGAGITDIEEFAMTGGVIRIIINWDCDLDESMDSCAPTYKFKRMDRFEHGYRMHYARHYSGQGNRKRDVIKANGIRFLVSIEGTGNKFDFRTAAMTGGSYLSYALGGISLITTMLFLSCGYWPSSAKKQICCEDWCD